MIRVTLDHGTWKSNFSQTCYTYVCSPLQRMNQGFIDDRNIKRWNLFCVILTQIVKYYWAILQDRVHKILPWTIHYIYRHFTMLHIFCKLAITVQKPFMKDTGPLRVCNLSTPALCLFT